MMFEDDFESNKKKILDEQEEEDEEDEEEQEEEQTQPNTESEPEPIEAPDIPGKEYFEYLVSIIKKTVRREDALIRLILDTAFSAYSTDPINLAIMAPTSEGKTHPIVESLNHFPKGSVIFIGKMSTMALVRDQGILVDENNKPIQSEVDGLKWELKHYNNCDDEEKKELRDKLSNLLRNSKKLIDLSGKILVFLEPPDPKLWDLIKPILSHDTFEIQYDYVNKEIETQKVVVRGFPACIWCSAKDESNWSTWAEIQSRFLITSPNMTKEKYEESTLLIAQRRGLPSFIQGQVIVSNKDIELAKQCVQYVKQELKKLTESKIDVWIPFYDILARAIKTDKGTDVRNNSRIFAFLNIIPLIKSKNRLRLCINGHTSIIAELQDLSEVLVITQNLSGLPAYKIKFFKEILYPLWRAKTEPDKSADKTKEEDGISVTTKELREEYKSKYGKVTTTDNLKKTFLNELHNNGYIEEEVSVINNKQYVYKPLVAGDDDDKISISFISNSGQFDNVLQHSRLLVPKNFILPPKNWLEIQISEFKRYRIDETCSSDFIKLEDIQILDSNGNKVQIEDFITKYEQHVKLIRYLKTVDFSNNYNKTDTNTENKEHSDSKDVKEQRIESNSISKISFSNKIEVKPQDLTLKPEIISADISEKSDCNQGMEETEHKLTSEEIELIQREYDLEEQRRNEARNRGFDDNNINIKKNAPDTEALRTLMESKPDSRPKFD